MNKITTCLSIAEAKMYSAFQLSLNALRISQPDWCLAGRLEQMLPAMLSLLSFATSRPLLRNHCQSTDDVLWPSLRLSIVQLSELAGDPGRLPLSLLRAVCALTSGAI